MIPVSQLSEPRTEAVPQRGDGRDGYRGRVRVAIVTDYCFPQLGGISEVVHAQALGLTAHGHEVTVVTGHLLRRPEVADDPRPPHDEAYEIIRVGAAIPLFGNGSATLHTIPPLLTETLRRLFRKRRFDVVHVHAPYNPGMCLIAPLAIPSGTIGVGTYHSVFEPGKGLNTFGRLMRWSLAKLDGHVVVAPACVDSLERYFPFDYEYIPNGVDADRYRPEGDRIDALRADGKPVILFLGRFDPRNGLGNALKAFERVHAERNGDARLVICGDGPLKHIYRRQLPDTVAADVHWAGRVDWSRPSYYRTADVLCIPCQRAACSMVPLEGMASGVPIVASRIPGFELAIDHDEQGLLVDDFEQPDGFAESILHLLSRPDERVRMGVEGRERALANYSLGAITAQYEALYARLGGQDPDALPPPLPEPVGAAA
jgi:phosphatidylinositol alpha-mannosyltransferase